MGGEDNAAEMTFTGEATEAAKTFLQNGMLAAINGNGEFCQDRKCSRVMLATQTCAINLNHNNGKLFMNMIVLLNNGEINKVDAKIVNVVNRVQLVMNVTNKLVNATASQE